MADTPNQPDQHVVEAHPLFNGKTSVGMISGENPRFPAQASGHGALGEALMQMGIKHEEREGRYGAPEKSYMVYGPSREQMYQLGKMFGQESVVFSNGGKHELLYTNGPKAGKFHPALNSEWFKHPPEDYYTNMPELGGFLRLNFDWDQLHPTNLHQDAAVQALHDRAAAQANTQPPVQADRTVTKSEIARGLAGALKKALAAVQPRREHPLAYEWHNEHTDHHLHVMSPGVVLRSNQGEALAKAMWRPPSTNAALNKMPDARYKRTMAAESANKQALQQMGFEHPPKAGRSHGDPHQLETAHNSSYRKKKEGQFWEEVGAAAQLQPVPSPIFSKFPAGTKFRQKSGYVNETKYDRTGNLKPEHRPWLKKAEPHPHMDQGKHAPNDQAAGVGVSTYAKYALPYGAVDKTRSTDLFHYPYQGKNQEIDRLVKDHGYTTYYAGGKYGRPDLAARNYNTKHLMVYDPSPGSGGDFGHEAYTDGWRKIHELSHALVYPELNQIYGEGRRIGKLGHHRSLREALRAVHWEWLAAHKQRELGQQIGVHVPDHVFHKELNTVMHDAIHRAVTGKFTEPSAEGFTPHEHKVPLEHALGMVREAAHNLGITGMHDLIKKNEGTTTMADDTKLDPKEWRQALAKGLRDRVDSYSKEMLALRERELKKSDPALAAAPAPEMKPMPVDPCPLCGAEDLPGKCMCLQGPAAAPALQKDGMPFANKPAPGAAPAGSVIGRSGYQITQPIPKRKVGAGNAGSIGSMTPSDMLTQSDTVSSKTPVQFSGGHPQAAGRRPENTISLPGAHLTRGTASATAPMKPAVTKNETQGYGNVVKPPAPAPQVNKAEPMTIGQTPTVKAEPLCKPCGKSHEMGKCGLDEVKPGPSLKKVSSQNAAALASNEAVAKKEFSSEAKAKEPVKGHKSGGNGIKIRPIKKALGDPAPNAGSRGGAPKPAGAGGAPPAPAAKPKFGMAQLAAGKAGLQAAGVKPMSPLGAPKLPGAAPAAAPKPAAPALPKPPGPPAGTAHLSPPPAPGAAPKPAGAAPAAGAKPPAMPKPAAPKPAAAPMGKGEKKPADRLKELEAAKEKNGGFHPSREAAMEAAKLGSKGGPAAPFAGIKKSLGDCALCAKPEHTGSCS